MNEDNVSRKKQSNLRREIWPYVLFAAITCIAYALVTENKGLPHGAYGWSMTVAEAVGVFIGLYVVGYLLALLFSKQNRGRKALIIGSIVVWLLLFSNLGDRQKEERMKQHTEATMAERTEGGEFFDPKEFISSNGYDSVGQNPQNTTSSKRIYRKYTRVGSGYEDFKKSIASTYTSKNSQTEICDSLIELSKEFIRQSFGPYSSYGLVDHGGRGFVTKCVFTLVGASETAELIMLATGDETGAYHVFIQKVEDDGSSSEDGVKSISITKAADAPKSGALDQPFSPYNYVKSLRKGVTSTKLPPPDNGVTVYSANIVKSQGEMNAIFGQILNDYKEDPVADITCQGIGKNSALGMSQELGIEVSFTLVGSGYKDGYQSCAFIASAPGFDNKFVYNYQHKDESLYFVIYAEDPGKK